MEHYRVLDPHDYLFDQLKIGLQPDSRSLAEFRPISLQTNLISSANGSSLVRLGDAVAVTCIKGEIVDERTFFSAAENDSFSSETYIFQSTQKNDQHHKTLKGKVVINIEGQPHFSDSKNNEISKTTSILQTLVDENKIVDLKDLAIGGNKNVFWILYVDVSILNCDGVLLDICLLGVSAALLATTLPNVTLVPEEMDIDLVDNAAQIFPDKICVGDAYRCLKLIGKSSLTSCSFLLLDSEKSENREIIISCDPVEFEINLFPNNILTLVIGESKNSDQPEIHAIYKYGGTCLADEEIFEKCLSLAAKRRIELYNLLDDALTQR